MSSGRKNFIRVPEDFVCENCGERISGSGYTNHCPKCLYSKHVDEKIPGDRKSNCGGLMAPIGLDRRRGRYIIVHKCLSCGQTSRNTAAEGDDFDALLDLARRQV